jgi:hypothetical protein
MFDQEPEGDPHGECALEINRLSAALEGLQAEVISLKAFNKGLQEDIRRICGAIPGYEWCGTAEHEIAKVFAERDSLRQELGDLPEAQSDMLSELKKLRAELSEAQGMLLWALWHNEGASSPVGHPIRRALGIGQHDPMTAEQIRAGSDAVAKVMTHLPDTADQIPRVAPTVQQPAEPVIVAAAQDRKNYASAQHPDWGGVKQTAKQAQPEPVNAMLLEALQDTAQTLEWMQHGNCRGISERLLTTNEALEKANTAISEAKQAQPEREPLTDYQIFKIVTETSKVVGLPYDFAFVRAIEAAHGIKQVGQHD